MIPAAIGIVVMCWLWAGILVWRHLRRAAAQQRGHGVDEIVPVRKLRRPRA